MDFIFFGATGFTGQRAVEYFAHLSQAENPYRWAVAGRSRKKLEELMASVAQCPNPPSEAFVVDHSDAQRVTELVRQAKVVLNFAGPFNRYGSNVVAACAESGVHYLDITGETLWVREMIRKHESAAKKSGAILIPFSGFDSVPSDLGVWSVLERAREQAPGKTVTRVMSLFKVGGGLNGGSFQTLMDILSYTPEQRGAYEDPALLVPAETPSSWRTKFRFRDSKWPRKIPGLNPGERDFGAPFFMAPINSRVVYRSQALRAGAGDSARPPFEYVELMDMGRVAPAAKAFGFSAGFELFNRVGRNPHARKWIEKLGPKAGQGPSEQAQESGFFQAQFFALAGDDLIARSEMSFPGDPGNKATAALIAESALGLREGKTVRPNLPGGFWTPSTALGSALCDRLRAAGFRIT